MNKHVFLNLLSSPYAALSVSFESWLRCHTPHSLSSPIIHTDIASFFFIAHAQYPVLPLVKRTVYTEKWNVHAIFYFTLTVFKACNILCSFFFYLWNGNRISIHLDLHLYLFFSLWDTKLYTVILNFPFPTTILILEWTMHWHNIVLRSCSMKYNALYVLWLACVSKVCTFLLLRF